MTPFPDVAKEKEPSYLASGVEWMANEVLGAAAPGDPTRRDIVDYGTNFVKTAALFVPGKYGRFAAAAVYGVDQMHGSDNLSTQVLDGGLGAGKGLLLSKGLSLIGGTKLGPAEKGFLMGFTNRAAELGFNRHTYDNGLMPGLEKLGSETFNRQAVSADISSFLLAEATCFGLNRFTGDLLKKNAVAGTMMTGFSFGLTNGALAEVQTQRAEFGTVTDSSRVLKKALIHGGLDSIAAIPGGLLNQRAMSSALREAQTNTNLPADGKSPVQRAIQPTELVADTMPANKATLSPGSHSSVKVTLASLVDLPTATVAVRPNSGHSESSVPAPDHSLKEPAPASKPRESAHEPVIASKQPDTLGARPKADKPVVPPAPRNVQTEAVPTPAERLAATGQGHRKVLFLELLKSSDQSIRLATAEALATLPSGQRYTAWREMITHADPVVTKLAINAIADLPPAERLSAWRHVYHQNRLINLGESRLPDATPITPAAREVANKAASQILVDQIAHLRSADREAAWKQAYDRTATRDAAVSTLRVLPESVRMKHWEHLWERESRSSLLSQIPDLPSADRMRAWSLGRQNNVDIEPGLIAKVLESLPVDSANRRQIWDGLVNPSGEQVPAYRGAFEAIQALAEGERSSAWNQAFDRTGGRQMQQAAEAAAKLPAEARMPALRRILLEAPGPLGAATENLIRGVRANEIAELQDTILAIQDRGLQSCVANALPIWKLIELPLAQRQEALLRVFQTANAHPEAFPADVLRTWWGRIPEQPAANEYVVPTDRRVSQYLAARLPAEQLGRILFSHTPDLAKQISEANPQAVRRAAERFDPANTSTTTMEVLESTARTWLQTRSLLKTTEHMLTRADAEAHVQPAADLLAGIAATDSPGRADTIILLQQRGLSTDASPAQIRVVLNTVAALRATDAQGVDAKILKPLNEAINHPNADVRWALDVGKELARLERTGRLGDFQPALPNLRMLPIAELSTPARALTCATAEDALRSGRFTQLLGDGALGRVMPTVFGPSEAGGMHGRPIGTDGRTTIDGLLEAVRTHPRFRELPEVDRMNLLWATVLSEAADGRALSPQARDMQGAKLGYGVLGSLGYAPERIQRIANLVSRASDFREPTQRSSWSGEDLAVDLAAYNRNPSAPWQLQILSEAQVATGVRTGGDAQTLGDRAIAMVRAQRVMSAMQAPVVLSAVPEGFGLTLADGNWRYLAHSSGYMDSTFMRQLPSMQSPNYSWSTSLVTPAHKHVWAKDADFVGLVTAPPENIYFMARSSFTGTDVGWNRYVGQLQNPISDMTATSGEINSALRRQGERAQRAVGSLRELNLRLAQVDSLGMAQAQPQLALPLETIFDRLTKDTAGRPLGEANEFKLNNGTLNGIGIMRRGRSVYFEGMTAEAQRSLLNGAAKPAWLLSQPQPGALVVPASLWRGAQQQRVRFVVLDG